MIHQRPSWNPVQRGLTLIEALLAIALSAIIASAAMMVLYSTGSTMTMETEFRRGTVRRHVAISRLGALTRGSGMVLGQEGDRLTLWTGDANMDDRPNLSELRLISWLPAAQDITVYEAPVDLGSIDDVAYELDEDFGSVMNTIAGSAVFPGQVVFTRVSAWQVALDSPDPQSARRLRIRMTIENEGESEMAMVTVSLRSAG